MGFTWRSTHQRHKYIQIKLNIFNFKQVEMQWETLYCEKKNKETVMAGCLEFTYNKLVDLSLFFLWWQ